MGFPRMSNGSIDFSSDIEDNENADYGDCYFLPHTANELSLYKKVSDLVDRERDDPCQCTCIYDNE